MKLTQVSPDDEHNKLLSEICVAGSYASLLGIFPHLNGLTKFEMGRAIDLATKFNIKSIRLGSVLACGREDPFLQSDEYSVLLSEYHHAKREMTEFVDSVIYRLNLTNDVK